MTKYIAKKLDEEKYLKFSEFGATMWTDNPYHAEYYEDKEELKKELQGRFFGNFVILEIYIAT